MERGHLNVGQKAEELFGYKTQETRSRRLSEEDFRAVKYFQLARSCWVIFKHHGLLSRVDRV